MRALITLVIAIIVIGGAYVIITQSQDGTETTNENSSGNINTEATNTGGNTNTSTSTGSGSTGGSATSTGSGSTASVKSFTVTGTPFKFEPSAMTVRQGDRVRITFINAQGMHDWKIDEFNAATKVLPSGQQETIEFVADKAGSFEYYCSVTNHRAMGMKGTLTVTQ